MQASVSAYFSVISLHAGSSGNGLANKVASPFAVFILERDRVWPLSHCCHAWFRPHEVSKREIAGEAYCYDCDTGSGLAFTEEEGVAWEELETYLLSLVSLKIDPLTAAVEIPGFAAALEAHRPGRGDLVK